MKFLTSFNVIGFKYAGLHSRPNAGDDDGDDDDDEGLKQACVNIHSTDSVSLQAENDEWQIETDSNNISL